MFEKTSGINKSDKMSGGRRKKSIFALNSEIFKIWECIVEFNIRIIKRNIDQGIKDSKKTGNVDTITIDDDKLDGNEIIIHHAEGKKF